MRAIACVGALLCFVWVLSVVGAAMLRRSMQRRVMPYVDGVISAFDRPGVSLFVQLARAVREPRWWAGGLANVVLLLVGIDVAAELSDREVRHAVEDGIAEQRRLAEESFEQCATKDEDRRNEEEEP